MILEFIKGVLDLISFLDFLPCEFMNGSELLFGLNWLRKDLDRFCSLLEKFKPSFDLGKFVSEKLPNPFILGIKNQMFELLDIKLDLFFAFLITKHLYSE